MFADTLLAAERGHLLRLALWGAMSVVAGSAILALLSARRVRSPLLQHFAIQTAAWGGGRPRDLRRRVARTHAP